jgi:hypothetical protein
MELKSDVENTLPDPPPSPTSLHRLPACGKKFWNVFHCERYSHSADNSELGSTCATVSGSIIPVVSSLVLRDSGPGPSQPSGGHAVQVPPSEHWYMVTRGKSVGVFSSW